MPFATNPADEVGIHYELHGSGPAMLLHHGGGSSLERWHDFGYVQALSRNFLLVLVDARGHGKSDRPDCPEAYRYERWVTDLVAVLDDAGIKRAHFFGYSLGGLIGFRIPQYAPQRFDSLILGGAHPYAQYDFFNQQYENFKDGLDGYLKMRERQGNPVSEPERTRLEDAHLDVYANVGLALRDEPGAIEHLRINTLPMLLFIGEDDATDGSNEKLPAAAVDIANSTLLTVPGFGHSDLVRRPDLILPCVLAFIGSL